MKRYNNKMSFRTIAILILLLISSCDLQKGKLGLRRLADDNSERTFTSLLSPSEVDEYEELLDMKLAFQKSIEFLPDAFEPNKEE